MRGFTYASDPPDLNFDEIDQLLDNQFEEKNNQIDAIYEAYSKAIDDAFKGASKKISVHWPKDIRLPSKSIWVGYAQDLKTRSFVNYKKGEVIIETKIKDNNIKNANKNIHQMARSLSSNNNSDIVKLDVFSKELKNNLAKTDINLKEPKPDKYNTLKLLIPENTKIKDSKIASFTKVMQKVTKTPEIGKTDTKTAQKKRDNLPKKQTKNAITQETVLNTTQNIKSGVKLELIKKGQDAILRMSIKFVNNYQKILMEENFDDVKRFSTKYNVPVSIILAIIETESSFNPRAVSAVPAFGLMQLVPKTAGVDAHNYVHGEKRIVSPDFLFDETNNLQLGTAYFKLLQSRYLRKIKDPQSRFYCAVASYNTGIGNLAKTFIKDKNLSKAALKINNMTPEQVYQYLIVNLPAQETKNYLKKIVSRKAKYEHFDS
ncbi:membrane-bound lytic murein transglycosylase C [Pseudoalteromonas denitrificans DSM 6059]|uniref:Membrane-bound lytic murein transglycosylase C n=2 Tax=Pseudoalteromonas TaxID=53246 RepID=A0A1I1FH32_9GAMM|nr:membrane-bound lytic murein transglycosylase C [Pseudoalteromonas denitrificans DSM 6059]